MIVRSKLPLVWPGLGFRLQVGDNDVQEIPERVRAKLEVYVRSGDVVIEPAAPASAAPDMPDLPDLFEPGEVPVDPPELLDAEPSEDPSADDGRKEDPAEADTEPAVPAPKRKKSGRR